LIWLFWGESQTKAWKSLDESSLSPFSSSPEEYASYVKSLQQEYASETFIKDRLKMLKTLLMIPTIFNNPKMRDRFESAARQNIQSEINDLQA
jgi:predicted metal-dependent HD superfamily phosphohydrolase